MNGKLVRDMIPGILEKSGKKIRVERLSLEKYKKALLEKLKEETGEVVEACEFKDKDCITEEVADLLEVASCLLKAHDISPAAFAWVKKDKREKKGSFEERYFLYNEDKK